MVWMKSEANYQHKRSGIILLRLQKVKLELDYHNTFNTYIAPGIAILYTGAV
jgi:hypothetical protein